MAQYIDKSALVAEIEARINDIEVSQKTGLIKKRDANKKIFLFKSFLSLINILDLKELPIWEKVSPDTGQTTLYKDGGKSYLERFGYRIDLKDLDMLPKKNFKAQEREIIMNIKKIVQNTSLLLFGLLLCIIVLPFYVIYCFGKALCDMDEWQDFTNAVWESVSGLHKAKRTVDYLRGLNIKYQHLRHYMDEVQDAVNEADMYNLILEILERYNKEFYKNKE